MEMRHDGTREYLVAKLRGQAEGWFHLAKDDLSAQAAQGVNDLVEGASSVRVGHTVYQVTDA